MTNLVIISKYRVITKALPFKEETLNISFKEHTIFPLRAVHSNISFFIQLFQIFRDVSAPCHDGQYTWLSGPARCNICEVLNVMSRFSQSHSFPLKSNEEQLFARGKHSHLHQSGQLLQAGLKRNKWKSRRRKSSRIT